MQRNIYLMDTQHPWPFLLPLLMITELNVLNIRMWAVLILSISANAFTSGRSTYTSWTQHKIIKLVLRSSLQGTLLSPEAAFPPGPPRHVSPTDISLLSGHLSIWQVEHFPFVIDITSNQWHWEKPCANGVTLPL